MEATVLSALQQRKESMAKKSAKQLKKKTKPIRVRYISNPMKVETCASRFRELVQELTGQGAADLPPEPSIFPADVSSPASGSVAAEHPAPEAMDDREPPDGNVFVPHMSESFSGCFPSGFYSVNALGSIDSV